MAFMGILMASSIFLPGTVTTEWVGVVQKKYTTLNDGETSYWLTVTKDGGASANVIVDAKGYQNVMIGNTVRVRHIQRGMLAGYSIEILT
jgi:hypothetical protein